MAITAANVLGRQIKQTVPYVDLNAVQQESLQEEQRTDKKNKGGVLGGVGYLGEKAAAGFMQSVEGIWDYSAGGIASLLGADAWAERQFKNDWFGDWYETAGEWYNPNKVMKVAGDVASGIGTSIPALGAAAGVTALAVATGGASVTPTILAIASGVTGGAVAGLGAAGTATKEAYRKTGELGGKEFGYGALVGLTEGTIEGVSDAIGMGTGAIVKSIAGGTARGIGKSAIKSTVKSASASLGKHAFLKTGAKAFLGEAFEEGVAEILSPYFARATYDPEAENATLQEVAYASFIGGLSGLVMGGAQGSVNMAQARISGGNIVASGNGQSVVDGARALLADAEKQGYFDSEAIKTLREVYDQYVATEKSGAEGTFTDKQKYLIGKMNVASTSVVLNEAIITSALHLVENADQVAAAFDTYNYTDENGNKVTFTADQIREGLDGKNKRGDIAQLLKKNSVLRALAAADAAGRLMADTQSVADAMLAGRQINEDVFADFVKNADERVKEETARELGIEDWNVVDAVATNIHIKDYMENRGGAEAYARRSLAASSFEQHRNTEGKEIPKSFRATKDGIYRYTSGSDNIAVKKDGDTYTIYDYDSKTLSKELTKEELNRALAKHARQAEKTTQSAEAVAEVSEQVTEVKSAQEQEKNTPKDSVVKRAEKLAQEKVVGYDKLNARNKKTVEKIIRQGIVRGVKEDVVIAYANVAARAKVDVVFDKKEFPVIGKNKEGKEVRANGLYEPHTETIYANPEAQSSDDILIHELDHAIRKTVGKDGAVTTKQYNDAILAVSDDVRQEIAKTYTEKRRISAIEKVEIANDEVEAYYAQTALGGKDIIRHLISQKPSLKQRILDFFKGAKEDYRSVPILDKQAAKYYKQYKKWFDEFAERRKYRNIEKGLAQFVDTVDVRYSFTFIAQSFFGKETMTVDEFLAGDYKTTEGYKKYVNECLSNMSQTRDNFNEANARKEIEASIDGIVRVAVAAKTAGYDIIDSAEARSKTDSKGRGLFTSLEPNSDYFTSHDISTICDKRKNFSDIHDDIVREEQRLGVPRGKGFFDNVSNYFVIHDILARKGMTAPCRECYVESMRKNLAPMAEAFLTLIEETNPENKQNKQLWSKGKQKVGNATLRDRVLEQMRSEGLPQNFFDKVMLTTEDGLAQLRIEHPLLYEAFNSFYGQSKPKMPKSSVPFRFGELTALLTDDKGKIKDSLVKKINSTGGFRLQSYSDFQIENFVDVLQVIFEAGTLGLSGHAYTKVPAFLTATEGTNLKRNMSVFMYQDGNEWRIDKNDSFPGTMDDLYQRVKADKSGNTGIIVVSQNDSNSAWIMANDYIGYGIPFHKSGIRMGVVRETIVREDGREIKGYSNVKDHTKFQSETWAKITADHKAGTKVKNGINIYDFWDFDNAEKLSRNDLIKKNVKRYINECEKLGYRPKFADYLKGGAILNETLAYAKKLGFAEQNATVDAISFKYKGYTIPYGYYKFLGDFSMFTFDGKSSPHEVLSLAKYDFDKAVSFFKDAENVRREEILQQFANGTERDRLRKSKMTTEELSKLLRKRRDEVVSEVVGRSKDVRASIDINNDIRYSIPLDAVDNYTEEQYNSFGWARVSEAITKNELDDVYSKLQEKKSLRRFKQSARGEAIIEVNDKPKTTLGVDNVFVFAKGSATEPEITRVLRVSLFSETDMEKVRKFIYDNEKRPNARTSVASRGIFFETGIFAEYARKDFGSYQEYRSEIRKRSSGSQSQRDQDAHRIEYERARYTRRSEDDVSYSIPLDTEIDSNYLDAVNRGDMETAQKMVDEAAKKMGYTKKAYHQTNADFTEFDLSKSREGVYGKGAYFSTEKSPKGTYGSKDMSLYMLDTRKFLDLPNDGEQLKQIFDRLGFPYDKTTLNNFIENAKNRNGFRLYEYLMHVFRFHVREDISPYATEHGYKGLFDANTGIYVVYDPNMVKSSDPVTYDDSGNVIPLSKRFDHTNSDIRYSDRDYSYESLVSKPDMKLTTVGGDVPSNRADVVAAAKKNAAKVGKFNPKDGSVSVHVEDIDTEVILGRDGLKHSLDRRFDVNAPVVVHAGEIISNSIRINEMTPQSENATESYVLIGAAKGVDGELYVVRSVVNRFSNELASMDVLYAINAKKESTVLDAPLSTENSALGIDSTISIAQLLEFVNRYFPDILPESVLRHFGHDARPEGKLGESVLYSDRDSYAPVFYSHMGKVIDDIKIAKMGAGGVVPYLKGKGVKNEEIKWSGIEAFLEGKKSVTKEELQEFVAGSQLQIVERNSADMDTGIELIPDPNTGDILLYIDGKLKDTYFKNANGEIESRETDDLFANEQMLLDAYEADYGRKRTRWSQYKLGGGTNYRELVFQMPNSSYSNRAMRGHWGEDAEGILVHARIQDFDTSEGKMLFVEELQSDWHNEGHEKGYSTEEYEAAVASRDKLYDEYKKLDVAFHKYVRSNEFMTDPEAVRKKKHDWLRAKVDAAQKKHLDAEEVVNSLKQKGMGDVADAPFRDTYHEYVMKRLIRMAAEEGYDIIGWTPSEIQVKRWSEEYAEGYRIEYDQEIPKFMRKYGKRWGTTVGKERIGEYSEQFEVDLNTMEDSDELLLEDGIKYDGVEVWSMPITDSMKQSVLTEGQPLYSDRSDSDISNRELLANSLESAAANDIERNKLAQYKQKIALINAEEQHLSELKAEIGELSFAKGKKDVKRIKDLQFEAKQTENRINTYDKQLLSLEASAPLKAVLDREKKMAYKKAEKRGKDALAAYREKAAADKRKLLERASESRKKGIEGRRKTEMRHKIRKVVSDLDKLLRHGSKDRNVKLGLQSAVASALEAVNMDTVAADERIAKLEKELMQAKTPEKIQEISRKIDHIREQGDKMSSKLESLRRAYVDIKNSEEGVPDYYKNEANLIAEKVDSVMKKVGDTPLRNMSLSQLEDVHNLYSMVLTTVRNVNSLFVKGKLDDLHQNVNEIMTEVESVKPLKEERLAVGDWWRKQSWSEMIPVYAFERIGSKKLTSFYWEVVRGQNTFATDISDAKEFSSAARKKYGYSKWDLGKIHEFKLADGRTLRVTLKHMMSIYAYSKREQALDHMSIGGFFFNDKDTFRKEKGVLKVIKSNEEGYVVSNDTFAEIMSAMTKEQIQYVDEMQDYLTKMGEKGNEVSRVLWGIDIFKEKVYFPLKSSRDFIYQANQPAQESSLKNDGMTKETIPHASNPIVLEAFDDVWANHVERMSKYHAFVLPIENLNKIHNYGTWVGTASMSVSTMLRARYSDAANEYLTQFIRDLNGASTMSGATNPVFGFFNKFKKTAVAASTSVVVQQPTAILRALAVMDARYFVGKPNLKLLSTQWNELQRHAPIAIIKDIGGFDAGGGMQISEWLNTDTKRGLDKVMSKVDDITMLGAALGDQFGWTSIWEAVKRETLHNNPKLSPTSEEFLQKAGERFTEIIVLTQVYDSTLSRSGFMRSKHESVKMMTSFMGEPTVSFNMLMTAVTQVKAKKITKRQAARTVGAVYASVVAASVASSMIYALRDDDDDESYLEKFAEALMGKLKDEINPLNMLPIMRDIMSIMDGWDVERTDVAIFKDIKDAFDGLFSENKSAWRKVEDFAGAIASLFGIPLKNTLRTGREIYNLFENIFDGVNPTEAGIKDSIMEGITGKEKSNGQQLYEAILSGDQKQIDRVTGRFKDQTAIDTAIRKALRENDPRIKEAAQAIIDEDYSRYTELANQIIDEGYFSENNVVAAIKSQINAMTKDEEQEEEETEDKEVSIYEMNYFYNAALDGDIVMAHAIKEDIVRTAVANGKDRDEAEKSFNSSFQTKCREAYKEGRLSESEAVRMLVNYGGKTEAEARSRVQSWQ